MAVAPVAVNPEGPLQLKVVPEVVELPVNVTLVVLQVSEPDAVAVTPAGAAVLEVTVTVPVPVPAELVPVTVYVPAVVAVTEAPAAVNPEGPDQLNVVPEVVELPVSVTLVWLQVREPETVAVTLAGAVVLLVTVTLPDPVPEELVTVTI